MMMMTMMMKGKKKKKPAVILKTTNGSGAEGREEIPLGKERERERRGMPSRTGNYLDKTLRQLMNET